MKFVNSFLTLLILASLSSCTKTEPEPVVEEKTPDFIVNSASSITTSSASVSGLIAGDDINEVGFIYGTSSILGIGSSTSLVGQTAGSIKTTITGLQDNRTYYYAAYCVNTEGSTFRSAVKSFKTLEKTSLRLGHVYEGGIIYYLDNSGEHGLLASPSNITTGTSWQAAKNACYAYTLQGNGSWRMPNKSELELMYSKRNTIGGFSAKAYWTSSTVSSNTTLAYGVFFGSGASAGQTYTYDKSGTYQYSRAIRSF